MSLLFAPFHFVYSRPSVSDGVEIRLGIESNPIRQCIYVPNLELSVCPRSRIHALYVMTYFLDPFRFSII